MCARTNPEAVRNVTAESSRRLAWPRHVIGVRSSSAPHESKSMGLLFPVTSSPKGRGRRLGLDNNGLEANSPDRSQAGLGRLEKSAP